MPHLLGASATQLEQWSATRDAQDALPELVRRLILATSKPSAVQFRSAEGVSLPGYDGIADAPVGNSFVPSGRSVWEMGVAKATKSKADADYEERTTDPLGESLADTTFVFVTPRRWKGRTTWEKSRQAEGRWKSVRVIDADDLRTWLDEAPSVDLWISRRLGIHLQGALLLTDAFEEYASVTKPAITADVLLAGRAKSVAAIRERLRGGPGILTLGGPTIDEVVAFLGAAIMQTEDELERDRLLARAICIDEEDTWRTLASRSGAILVPRFGRSEAIACGKAHHVIVPLAAGESGSDLTLERPSVRELAKALSRSGLSEPDAWSHARAAGGSPTALRRRLAVARSFRIPQWAQGEGARLLAPFVLFRAWDEASEADIALLARVVGHDAADCLEIARGHTDIPDAPLERVGSVVRWRAHEDAWSLLAPYLSSQAVTTFGKEAIAALAEPHPKFELGESDRLMAPLLGKVFPTTPMLRSGLCDVLAMLACCLPGVSEEQPAHAAAVAAAAVRAVLSSTRWELWASLERGLPDLAEAAPDDFLAAVETVLSTSPTTFVTLLRGESDVGFMGGTCLHAGLLWALEVVAWSPRYLSRASLALARLAELDPGSRWANRPSRSLRQIFLGWLPYTTATVEVRLNVLDLLFRRAPRATWPLLLDLLPEGHDSTSATYLPKWRDWQNGWKEEVSSRELQAFNQGVGARVAEGLRVGDTEQWLALLPVIDRLYDRDRDRVMEKLTSATWDGTSRVDRERIRHGIRGVLHHHREFPNASWALPEAALVPLQAAYDILTSLSGRIERDAWLFDQNVLLPTGSSEDWDEYSRESERQQIDAAARMFEERGASGVDELLGHVPEPWILGRALGQMPAASELADHILSHGPDPTDRDALLRDGGFSSGYACVAREGWPATIRRRAQEGILPPERAGYLLAQLPFSRSTWDTVAVFEPPVIDAYWRTVKPRFLRDGDAEGERALIELLRVGRPRTALDLTSSVLDRKTGRPRVPTCLLMDLLEAVASTPEPAGQAIRTYDVERVFLALQNAPDIDEQRLAALEWMFLPALRNGEARPRLLGRALAQEPRFFVEVLSLVFRAKSGDPAGTEEPTEEQRERAHRAFQLLRNWKDIPGRGRDGDLDIAVLRAWVASARTLAAAADRADIGDEVIGWVLSTAPHGSDGAWPHEAVREMIDEVGSAHLTEGVAIQKRNSRGVVTKSLEEGGEQERELAKQYEAWADVCAVEWPLTAAMLRELAEAYRAHGRHEDRRRRLDDQ